VLVFDLGADDNRSNHDEDSSIMSEVRGRVAKNSEIVEKDRMVRCLMLLVGFFLHTACCA
jgi:hypothetical protein